MAKDDLDRTDFEILAHLQKNARLSNKELAARVGLAPSSCLERVRRLVERRVLRGFHADVDPAALGIEIEAMIAVRLVRHSRKDVDQFRAHVMGLPEVVTERESRRGVAGWIWATLSCCILLKEVESLKC